MSQDTAIWLTAYDATTGDMRWQRGRTLDAADPLTDVEFRSLPIAVGKDLWVPFQRQRDLYVGLLDPADGSLIRSILLCALPIADPPLWHSLPAISSNGLVYVPTGQGVLFAVGAHDYSPRWANQYAMNGEGETSMTSAAPPRLPSSLVAAHGLVLLAPVDLPELLAFSAVDGALRWSAPIGETDYIIAAADTVVWLGGRRLSCLSLVDGETLWTSDVDAAPTGRAILSGDRIYVPTWEGLMSFHADSGESAGYEPLPSTQSALGNLLCIHNALYSLDPGSIRKFPDVDRAYPEALAKYEAEPSDVAAAVRLAWIELLRDAPQRAYEIVHAVADASGVDDEDRLIDLARVRVEALLALADRSTDSPTKALAWLEEAHRVARTPRDRLRCSLAYAQQLSVMGRHADAYRQLLTTGIEQDAARMTAVADYIDAPARFDIARRLRELQTKLGNDQRQALRTYVEERMAAAASALCEGEHRRDAELELRAIADLNPVEAAGPALLALADLRLDQRRNEQAEQLLLECARLVSDPATSVRALMKLYRLNEELFDGITAAREDVLDELASRFGDIALLDAADVRLQPQIVGIPFGRPMTVRDWVESERTRLASLGAPALGLGDGSGFAGISPPPQAVGHPRTESFRLNGQVAWAPIMPQQSAGAGGPTAMPSQNRGGVPTLVDLPPDVATIRHNQVLLQNSDGVLQCRDVTTGHELWQAALAPSEDFERERSNRYISSSGVGHGQLGIFSTMHGLFAVGLESGKRVWIRPRDGRQTILAEPSDRDMTIAAGDGWLVGVLNPGRLTMMRMLDGSTIWERDLRGEPVDQVQIFGQSVVAMDARLQRVQVFAAADGRLIQRVIFRQPNPESELVPLVVSDGVLCGPMGRATSDRVQGVDVASGGTLWEHALPKPLVRLFVPGSGYIGMAMLGGGIHIVEAASGEMVFEHQGSSIQKIHDGVMFDGTLLVRHFSSRDQAVTLTAIDIATGGELWNRNDLAIIEAVDLPLRVIGGLIPTVVLHGAPSRGKSQSLGLVMIDAHTGDPVGSGVDLMQVPRQGRRPIDIQIRPGVIVVGTEAGIFPFKTEPVTVGQAGDS